MYLFSSSFFSYLDDKICSLSTFFSFKSNNDVDFFVWVCFSVSIRTIYSLLFLSLSSMFNCENEPLHRHVLCSTSIFGCFSSSSSRQFLSFFLIKETQSKNI